MRSPRAALSTPRFHQNFAALAVAALAVAAVAGASSPFLQEALRGIEIRTALLVALPVALVVALRLASYDLLAPGSLFAATWLTALGIAQLPFLSEGSWSEETWVAVTIPPAALAVAAALTSGASPVRRVPLSHLFRRAGSHFDLTLILFVAVGGATTIYEFVELGQIPLLSATIDEARTQLVVNPFLHLLTRALPIAMTLALIAAFRASRKQRFFYASVAVVSGALVAGQGGRLHLVLPFFAAAVVLYATHGVSRRAIAAIGTTVVLVVVLLSSLFFYRIDQHPDNPFETLLYHAVLSTRPEILAWTVPLQLGISGGFYVLSNLIDARALEDPGPGFYSLHGLKRYLPAKDNQAVAAGVTEALITSTYISDLYGDFGLAGTVFGSLVIGAAYGLLYRRAVSTGSHAQLLLYAYAAFWLVFLVYFNVWTYEIFWIADVALLLVGAQMMRPSFTRPRLLPS